MKIQLLYLAGCPSWETALENLKAACALEGLPAEIEPVEVRDDTKTQSLITTSSCLRVFV